MNGIGETVLTVPKKKGDGYLIVVPVEKFYSTLKCIHESSGHARKCTMWNRITKTYAGLPRTVLEKFLKGCVSCQCRAAQVNEPEPKPIKATKVFERVQVDLIDLTTRPSGDFRYILHLMDHFSKFHMLHPLKRKTAEEVNNGLMGIFGTISLPAILQADNGTEFSQLGKIFEKLPGAGDVKVIHGRPAHPKSQGLVERGHRLVQDRVAIAEAEWLQSGREPFEWHQRLPIIQYQVNTAHSSTTKEMPYTLVFGREPKTLPLFGGEAHVRCQSSDSFSTDYDPENSDRELETNNEVEEEITIQDNNDETTHTESNPEEHEEEKEEVTNERNVKETTTPREITPEMVEEEEVRSENNDGEVTTPTETSRHDQFRQSALYHLEKAFQKRVEQKKPRKKVDKIKKGSYVTVAIPPEYRHKCDLRRITGVVVNQRGENWPTFMIRTNTCVIDGWFGADVVQLFDGVLHLVVEGWEHCPVLPLRVAAAVQRNSDSLATRCGCKTNCSKNLCRCKKIGNVCTSSCHGGRPCLNRASEQVVNDSHPRKPESINIVREFSHSFLRDLKQSRYSNEECEKALYQLSSVGTKEILEYIGKQTLHEFPAVPDHLQDSVDCLSNDLINEDEVIGWAAGFASESVVDSLRGDKAEMIKTVVEKELISGLAGNDSGPVQILAMANLIERPIVIHCSQAHSKQETSYGKGGNPIELLRVPVSLQPTDGHLRYNHFVPTLKQSQAEKESLVERCAAIDIGCCTIREQTTGLEYVMCEDCQRWFHSLCISHTVRGHAMKRQSSLSCGCLRIGPFKPTSLVSSMLTSEKEMRNFLQEHRPFLKAFLTDLIHKKIPSWRVNAFQEDPRCNKRLQTVSGLTIPTDEVAIKMRLFIDKQLPSVVKVQYKECVLFPEMLIRLMGLKWDLNKVEVEYIIKHAGKWNRHFS